MVDEIPLPRAHLHGDIVYPDGLGEYGDAGDMAALVQLALTFLRFGASNEFASLFPLSITHARHGFGCGRECLGFGDVCRDTGNDNRADIDIATQQRQ